ncbi:MAG: putative lipid II flippase FtsW [Candidatus Pacebacteria bacterium]|nr:putative lipid II flippase FtsW [Candidatus Paceibacterota bacterium]
MKFGGYDKILIFDVLLLVLFGLVMISSASVVMSYKEVGNQYYYLVHQFFYGLVPGVILACVFSRIDYRKFKKSAPLFLFATLFLLLIVFVPGLGLDIRDTRSWITVAGMSFQPSELAKLTLIIYLAAWLEERKKKLNDFSQGFVPFIMIIVLVAIPLIKQPDVGTLVAVCAIAGTMYFIAGAGITYILMMIAGGIVGVMTLIKIAPYRMNRLTTFLHPELDPLGIGYQINQSLLALGSGGLFGLGLGHSRQKFNYLPEPIGDSIFAVAGEELGLLGLIFLIILFMVFATRGLAIARSAKDDFGKYIAVGITAWVTFQAILNIGAITSLLPLTGIPLPFVSYGGSALMSLLAGVGVLLSVSRYSNSYKK